MKNTTLPDPPAAAPDGPVPAFPRCPGETPRAFGAFLAYFQLGRARSLPAVAGRLGETLGTVKNWSSKYAWAARLHAYHSGLLQACARDQAARALRSAADWNRRLHDFRELEWAVAQQLIVAAQCFLESFGEEELRRMTLAEVSRVLKISSALARSALAGAALPEPSDPGLSPLQQQLLAGVTRVYGQSPPSSPSSNPSSEPQLLTLNQ